MIYGVMNQAVITAKEILAASPFPLQALEDVICVEFLVSHFARFAAKLDQHRICEYARFMQNNPGKTKLERIRGGTEANRIIG